MSAAERLDDDDVRDLRARSMPAERLPTSPRRAGSEELTIDRQRKENEHLRALLDDAYEEIRALRRERAEERVWRITHQFTVP